MCGLYSWKNHTMVVIPHDRDVAPNRNPPLAIPNKTFIPVSPPEHKILEPPRQGCFPFKSSGSQYTN